MLYSLTDKLNFEDNPVMEIKGKKIEVKADAETVLALMDVVQQKGEAQTATDALDLLFTEKDKKTIKSLKLNFKDYMKVVNTAVSLALGDDPDKEDEE